MTSITIPNSVTEIGGWSFYECSGLTTVTIPNSVTTIGEDAFARCTGLTSVTIPNSVIEIGDWAFLKCSGLTAVTIPNSITEIGDYAFKDCYGLCDIYSFNTIPPACDGYVFSNVDKTNCRLHVPTGTRDDYALAKEWRDFYHILEDAEETADVSSLVTENDDAEYYTLEGVKVSDSTTPGIYVVKKDGESKMIVVKK